MIKAYASYFVSYLLKNLSDINNINRIILFGSAVKNELNKGSDVDVFVDVNKENKFFTNKVETLLKFFYDTNEALYFKTKGIDNKINIIISKLEKWKDLKKSIESTGIVLYGRYTPVDIEGKKYLIISWNNIKKNRGAFLNKIYGFKVNNKSYKGLLENFNGRKVGKSTVMIPIENSDKILNVAKYHKVDAKILEIYA